MSDPRGQMILFALSAAAQLAGNRAAQRHEVDMAVLRNEAFRSWADAVINNRVREVKEGFSEVLRDFAAQSAGMIEQRMRLIDRQMENNDAAVSIRIRREINSIDTSLNSIRADCRLIYDRMTDILLAMGDQMPALEALLPPASAQLALPR